MDKFRKYHQAVEYLENLPSMANGCFAPSASKDPGIYLERTRFFLGLIGNPEKKLKFIHVTGTSGKGSVSAMIQNILTASGKKTGLFSSPYVTTSIEKASVDGKYISPEKFVEIVEFFKPKIKEAEEKCPFGRPTYFEIFLALSLHYFAEQKCETVVLEVGCGGRHDATNVVENTEIAVITNIALDHTHIIGDTLEKIAFEKAGIVKKGSVLFTSEKKSEMLLIFEKECAEKSVPMKEVEDCVEKTEYVEGGMKIKIENIEKEIFSKLWGEHQKENISLAVAVAGHLGIDEGHVLEGIAKTELPCRFESMQKNPMVVLDGAHNPAKMASTVSNIGKMEYGKMILVLGVSQKKDVGEMLKMLIPKADHVIFTTFDFGPCYDPGKLLEISKGFLKEGAQTETIVDKNEALEKALSLAGENDLVLVTGSFYLSGELRKKWISEEYILENLESF